MNIQIGAPADIATPAAGYRTLFIDSTNNFLLTYKHSDGTTSLFSDSGSADCCACEISKAMAEAMNCALKNGEITADEYNAWILQGVNVSVTETDDGAGNKTCSVNIGPREPLS